MRSPRPRMHLLESLEKETLLRDVALSATQAQLLQMYLLALERWNKVINLTGLDGDNRVRRLVSEPLWVAEQLHPSGRYMDIGSGNGSPGIPWHVLRQFRSVDLVEAHGRKAVFLAEAVRHLDLKGVCVQRSRIETLRGAGPVDWFTLQGVRLTQALYRRLAGFAGTDSRLVWFTKPAEPPLPAYSRLDIPGSNRTAFVFRLQTRTTSGPR